MKIAFIHNDKKIGTGAHYINDLMATKLKERGVEIKNFYPRASLTGTPTRLGGIKNILFFYSLLERRNEILKFDLIQGTTYTPLPFLAFHTPVVSHFGSTTQGFLDNVPLARRLKTETSRTWYDLRKQGAIGELDIKTRRPLRDIADIEEYVARRATAVVATSKSVQRELLAMGVNKKKIHLVHNAIEDYWLTKRAHKCGDQAGIVFLGRLGNDAFTLKLKGLDRLVHLYRQFPNVQKSTFCITTNKKLINWMRGMIPIHSLFTNVKKDRLPSLLSPLAGSILFIPSRYEGFSLSLIEGMACGLIPVTYPVGVAPEIIKNNQNGFLVNSQAEAITTINKLLQDKALRHRLSRFARRTAHRFSGKVIAKKLINMDLKVISQNLKQNGTHKKTKCKPVRKRLGMFLF
ncbi:MAG: glycosyltransferase family 4 protein [Patescibacteria group bacterium]